MEITVKSVKVLKTGENKNGSWSLIGVTSDDGTNYATFHKSAANLNPGAVIEIGQPDIKEGKCSFKEYTVISEGTAAKPNGKPDMSKDDWAEKDRLERWSRECNTCFMGIPELLKLETVKGDKASLVYNAALDWALKHFNGTPAPVTKKEKPKTTADEDFEKLTSGSEFKNVGEFLTRISKEIGITSTAICEKLGGKDAMKIADYQAVYELLKENPDK